MHKGAHSPCPCSWPRVKHLFCTFLAKPLRVPPSFAQCSKHPGDEATLPETIESERNGLSKTPRGAGKLAEWDLVFCQLERCSLCSYICLSIYYLYICLSIYKIENLPHKKISIYKIENLPPQKNKITSANSRRTLWGIPISWLASQSRKLTRHFSWSTTSALRSTDFKLVEFLEALLFW